MAELAMLVGNREAPLGSARRGGELPDQPSVHRSPAGQLGGILVMPAQRGQPHPQPHPRTDWRALRLVGLAVTSLLASRFVRTLTSAPQVLGMAASSNPA